MATCRRKRAQPQPGGRRDPGSWRTPGRAVPYSLGESTPCAAGPRTRDPRAASEYMVLFQAPSLQPIGPEASARTRRRGSLCPGGPETHLLCLQGRSWAQPIPPALRWGHPQGTPSGDAKAAAPLGQSLSPRVSLPDEQAGSPEPSTALPTHPARVPRSVLRGTVTDVLRLSGCSPPWAVTTPRATRWPEPGWGHVALGAQP